MSEKPTIYTYNITDGKFLLLFAESPDYQKRELEDGPYDGPVDAVHALYEKHEVKEPLKFVDQDIFDLIVSKQRPVEPFNASAALKRYTEIMEAFETYERDDLPKEEMDKIKADLAQCGLRIKWLGDQFGLVALGTETPARVPAWTGMCYVLRFGSDIDAYTWTPNLDDLPKLIEQFVGRQAFTIRVQQDLDTLGVGEYECLDANRHEITVLSETGQAVGLYEQIEKAAKEMEKNA